MIEPIDTDQKTQDKSAQDQLKNLSEMEEASEKGENFLTKHLTHPDNCLTIT